jgi:hypothetical protein
VAEPNTYCPGGSSPLQLCPAGYTCPGGTERPYKMACTSGTPDIAGRCWNPVFTCLYGVPNGPTTCTFFGTTFDATVTLQMGPSFKQYLY